MDTIRIAGVVRESVVDGPGLRFVIFAQGCSHHCYGCHNPETWDLGGGQEATIKELLDGIRSDPLLKGVTLSGGDPFMQAGMMGKLAQQVKELGKDVITYTGYTWEQLIAMAEKDKGIKALLDKTDILVDGPFIQNLRDLGLAFRGSTNQRVIDVRPSLKTNTIVQVNW